MSACRRQQHCHRYQQRRQQLDPRRGARFGDNNDCNTGTATNSVDDAVTLALAAITGDDGLNRFEATATDGQVDIQP